MAKKQIVSDSSFAVKLSPTYLHENSQLQTRLDQLRKEQEKTIKKISASQETLAKTIDIQRGKSPQQDVSLWIRSAPKEGLTTLSSLESEIQAGCMQIWSPQKRKLSYSGSKNSEKIITRQLSDPLSSCYRGSLRINEVSFLRSKCGKISTTGVVGAPGLSGQMLRQTEHSDSSDFMADFLRVQPKGVTGYPGIKQSSCQQPAIRSSTSSSLLLNGKQYSKDKLRLTKSAPSYEEDVKEVGQDVKDTDLTARESSLGRQYGSMAETAASDQSTDYSGSDRDRKPKSAPVHLLTKRHSKDSGRDEICISDSLDLAIGTHSGRCFDFNLNATSKKRYETKLSLSEDVNKNVLRLQSNCPAPGGSTSALRNAWSEEKITQKKALSEKSSTKNVKKGYTSSKCQKAYQISDDFVKEEEHDFKALRNFRRLALAAIASKKFREDRAKSASEKDEKKGRLILERKLSSRLESSQKPTESYLRQITSIENPPTISRITAGSSKASISGSGIRRASQAAMATRMLIARHQKKAAGNGCQHSMGMEHERPNQNTLPEMMNALKDCRYLRSPNVDE